MKQCSVVVRPPFAIALQIEPTQVYESRLLPLLLSLTARILKSPRFLGIVASRFLLLLNRPPSSL